MMKKKLQSVEVMAPSATDGPVWVEIARAGVFKGYSNGGFELNAQRFGEVVRNFRAHPSYQLGPNGEGKAPVVPWDFNHASEQSPTSGSLPNIGAPAQGWVLDLDIRPGPNGVALWALTQWGDLARQYIRAGQYRWASVTLIFGATDPKTGQNVGTLLTSVALTNNPFIEGMQPLAASRGAASESSRVIHVKLPPGVRRNSREAQAILRKVAEQLATPRDADDDYHAGCDDSAPTPTEAALLDSARRGVAERNALLPMRIDASASTGRNACERAINAMREKVPGFAKLSWEEQCGRATEAVKLGVVRA